GVGPIQAMGWCDSVNAGRAREGRWAFLPAPLARCRKPCGVAASWRRLRFFCRDSLPRGGLLGRGLALLRRGLFASGGGDLLLLGPLGGGDLLLLLALGGGKLALLCRFRFPYLLRLGPLGVALLLGG